MSNTAQDEEEWEYEYSPTQTSTFYIPIDLSNVPSTHKTPTSDKRPGHPTLLKSRLRALAAARIQPTAQSTAPGNGDADIDGDADGQEEPAVLGEIQITGLHTENPLMVYNGELLSCHWSQTVGTDLFFVKDAKKDEGSKEEVLRELNGVDLLAVGSAKLVAKVGRLRPRDDLFDVEDGEDIEKEDGMETGKGKEKEKETSSDSAAMEQGATTSTIPSSSEFLSRLNEAKLRRGERTRLLATQTPEGIRLSTEMVAAILPTVPPRAPEQEVAGDNDVSMGGT